MEHYLEVDQLQLSQYIDLNTAYPPGRDHG